METANLIIGIVVLIVVVGIYLEIRKAPTIKDDEE
jgi:hypothetical protein